MVRVSTLLLARRVWIMRGKAKTQTKTREAQEQEQEHEQQRFTNVAGTL